MSIIHGDCIEQMRLMDAASVDAIVTDPPYELAFMGKRWDASGIAYNVEMWGECLRVLKPGGHLLSFGGTRTYHRMVCAIEDAGFEIRDSIHWIYATGFPKSLDVGKAIDKAAGAEREVVGPRIRLGDTRDYAFNKTSRIYGKDNGDVTTGGVRPPITAPATDAAKQWDGWGTALKPAHEIIVMARKPFTGGVAQNVETWGTGAVNVDGCRIEGVPWQSHVATGLASEKFFTKGPAKVIQKNPHDAGRWPSNLVLSHSPDCEEACADDCPVAELDRQSGIRKSGGRVWEKGDAKGGNWRAHEGRADVQRRGSSRAWEASEGGASRYFPVFRYEPKASSRERLLPDGTRSNHPTVKPLSLMRWLVRLVTPPDGIVLDPFAGSGTTLVAALEEGFDPIGIEQSAEYCAIIRARCDAVQPRLVEESA